MVKTHFLNVIRTMSTLKELYNQWCKETKRSGGILVGGSIQEFFIWLDNNNYIITKKNEQ